MQINPGSLDCEMCGMATGELYVFREQFAKKKPG
jgi:hypothetical protein